MIKNVKQSAIEYAAKGYYVFPLRPKNKEPAYTGGFNRATTDEAVIREWWNENPAYNLAIRTGKESEIIVLDVDGDAGQSTLRDKGWNTPATVTVETGKGFHFYYRYPAGGEIDSKVGLADGIDVRADKGYVVAPPSTHPNGSTYRWIVSLSDAQIADVPQWLLKELKQADSGPRKQASTVPEVIEDGKRNDTLFSVARFLFYRGLDKVEVYNALESVNDNRCTPPLPARELAQIVKSAATYGIGTLNVSDNGYREMYVDPEDTEDGFNADELMDMTIEPMKWAIPDLLPEGVTVLGGKPKIGKSWLALGLCVATATGGVALGTKHVDQGDVLYLALEDNKRRLQDRLRKILDGRQAPNNLQFNLDWPRLNEGGTERLEAWLQNHPNARLVVIDTLAMIRKPGKGNNVYAEDYGALQSLIPLAAEYGVAIVVVHHVRKQAADDPLDELNASTGLSGGVDSALILKRGQGSADGTLYVRGRDVEEQSLALRWDANVSGWAIVGDAADFAMSQIRQQIKHLLMDVGELGPKDIAARLEYDYEQVRQELVRMVSAEQLVRVGRGKYTVPTTTVTSVTTDTPVTGVTTVTTVTTDE